jgi:hypothetical protein
VDREQPTVSGQHEVADGGEVDVGTTILAARRGLPPDLIMRRRYQGAEPDEIVGADR